MNQAWLDRVSELIRHGEKVSPRGIDTRELRSPTFEVDMRQPVLTVPARKLSYRFAAAEAVWILTGQDTVNGIAPWNKHIAAFSDDGEKFFGAYGPKIEDQFSYVVQKLRSDPDTRQAGLTIWRENPPATKDYPCTIAVWFMQRRGFLNTHVFMRSSDVWLGLPYDVFNFSMLTHKVCAYVDPGYLAPGQLYLTAASSHLYDKDLDAVYACLDTDASQLKVGLVPQVYASDYTALLRDLVVLRDSKPGDPLRWWER